MSKGGGKQQQTQSVDPQIKAEYLSNLEAAKQTAGGLGVKQFADFTPEYQAAQQKLTNLGMAGFTPESIQQFMNPYQAQVIASGLNDIENQRQMMQVAEAGRATAAKAFGGSRQGVTEALTNKAALEQSRKLVEDMGYQGYGQAAQLAQQAQTMNLQGLGAVMSAQQQPQLLEQQRLDAMRNLPLEQLALRQAALSAQPANLGMTSSTPTSRNAAAGALGGAMAGAQIGSVVPGVGTAIGAGVGGLIGLMG